MKRFLLGLGLFLALVGCPPSVTPPLPGASDASFALPEGGYPDDDGRGDVCNKACSRLWSLGCPESVRNDAGLTCVALCRQEGPMLQPTCISEATSKSMLAKCHVRCQ